jgi:hypothetical protein
MKYKFPFDLVAVSPLSHILLNLSSKDDLLELCEDYQIACSRSMNKTDLSNRIEATLLAHPEILAESLPLSDLQVLKKIVDAGGTLQTKEPLLTSVLEEQMLVVSPAESTTKEGKAERVFRYAIAKNLQLALKPVIQKLVSDPKYRAIDKNEYILLGFLRLYGILSESTLRDLWEKTIKKVLDPYDLIQLFRTRIAIKQEFAPFYADNKLCFAPIILDFPMQYYEAIRKRSDLDYAIYPADVVLSFADSPFYSKDKTALHSLVQWLNKKNNGDEILLAFQMGIIWESIQTGEKMTDLLKEIHEITPCESSEEISELMRCLSNFSNNTTHWLLKGHIPSDLYAKKTVNVQDPGFRRELDEQLKKQFPDADNHQMWNELDEKLTSMHVGRNDLCPCGSGKKYKKCCGAN